MSFTARSSQGGAFRSLQGSYGAAGSGDQHNAMQLVGDGQPGLKERLDGNGARGDFDGGRFAGDFAETNSLPGSNVRNMRPSSLEPISVPPTALPDAAQPEGRYRDNFAGTVYVAYMFCVCVVCVCLNVYMHILCECVCEHVCPRIGFGASATVEHGITSLMAET